MLKEGLNRNGYDNSVCRIVQSNDQCNQVSMAVQALLNNNGAELFWQKCNVFKQEWFDLRNTNLNSYGVMYCVNRVIIQPHRVDLILHSSGSRVYHVYVVRFYGDTSYIMASRAQAVPNVQ